MDDRSGPGMKKANMAATFKFIAFQKSGEQGNAAAAVTTPQRWVCQLLFELSFLFARIIRLEAGCHVLAASIAPIPSPLIVSFYCC